MQSDAGNITSKTEGKLRMPQLHSRRNHHVDLMFIEKKNFNCPGRKEKGEKTAFLKT